MIPKSDQNLKNHRNVCENSGFLFFLIVEYFPEKHRIDPGSTYNRSEMLWGDFGASLSRFESFSVPVWVDGLNKMRWGRISKVRFRRQKRVSEGCFGFVFLVCVG